MKETILITDVSQLRDIATGTLKAICTKRGKHSGVVDNRNVSFDATPLQLSEAQWQLCADAITNSESGDKRNAGLKAIQDCVSGVTRNLDSDVPDVQSSSPPSPSPAAEVNAVNSTTNVKLNDDNTIISAEVDEIIAKLNILKNTCKAQQGQLASSDMITNTPTTILDMASQELNDAALAMDKVLLSQRVAWIDYMLSMLPSFFKDNQPSLAHSATAGIKDRLDSVPRDSPLCDQTLKLTRQVHQLGQIEYAIETQMKTFTSEGVHETLRKELLQESCEAKLESALTNYSIRSAWRSVEPNVEAATLKRIAMPHTCSQSPFDNNASVIEGMKECLLSSTVLRLVSNGEMVNLIGEAMCRWSSTIAEIRIEQQALRHHLEMQQRNVYPFLYGTLASPLLRRCETLAQGNECLEKLFACTNLFYCHATGTTDKHDSKIKAHHRSLDAATDVPWSKHCGCCGAPPPDGKKKVHNAGHMWSLDDQQLVLINACSACNQCQNASTAGWRALRDDLEEPILITDVGGAAPRGMNRKSTSELHVKVRSLFPDDDISSKRVLMSQKDERRPRV